MVLAMPDEEPRKMEEIRRFSAIYGRFDCKRKPEKPLTLHEVHKLYGDLGVKGKYSNSKVGLGLFEKSLEAQNL